jgi:hypothetical protein
MFLSKYTSVIPKFPEPAHGLLRASLLKLVSGSNSPLKNYLRWQYFVENSLGCEPSQNAHLEKLNSLASPVRFIGCFRLVLPASPTFFNDLF